MYDTAYRWMSVETPLTTSIMKIASGSISRLICASTPTVFARSHATVWTWRSSPLRPCSEMSVTTAAANDTTMKPVAM